MKKQYTKKQIQEAISYWRKRLEESGSGGFGSITFPPGPDGKPAYAYIYLSMHEADRDAYWRHVDGDILIRNENADLSELKKQYKLVFDYRT